MGNPTTRNSTPPQSARIGQPTRSSAVILQAYPANSFPGIAFTGQLAIDLDDNTLKFYDDNGAWQGVPGANDTQSFYEPTAPTSGMNVGDQWYDTANDNALSYWSGTAWTPVPFGTNAIANTITGTTIQTAASGLRIWLSGQPSAYSYEELISLWYSTGLANEAVPGRVAMTWAPLDTELTANTGSGPITSLDINPAPWAAPANSTVNISSRTTTAFQSFQTSGQVNIGDATIPIYSANTTFDFQIGDLVEWQQPVPDNNTAIVGLGLIPPVLQHFMIAKKFTPFMGIEQTCTPNPLAPQSFAQIIADTVNISGTHINLLDPTTGDYQMQLTGGGVLVGQYAARGVKGMDFGAHGAVLTGSGGGYVQSHGLGTTPAAVIAVPFTSSNSQALRVSAYDASSFTLQFYNPQTGADLVSTDVGFFWLVLA